MDNAAGHPADPPATSAPAGAAGHVSADPAGEPAWEPTWLPLTDLTVDRARARLSGLHFSKESLSEGEQSLLYIAEGLLRLLDERDPHGYLR